MSAAPKHRGPCALPWEIDTDAARPVPAEVVQWASGLIGPKGKGRRFFLFPWTAQMPFNALCLVPRSTQPPDGNRSA